MNAIPYYLNHYYAVIYDILMNSASELTRVLMKLVKTAVLLVKTSWRVSNINIKLIATISFMLSCMPIIITTTDIAASMQFTLATSTTQLSTSAC